MLAIECSQRSASVAVGIDGGFAEMESVQSDRRSDDDLLPAIDRLLSRLQMKPTDLTATAVSVGPGGFTGLRIAVAVTKMLGLSLGVQLVAVPSALVAVQSLSVAGPILVALACKGDTFWATRLDLQSIDWTCLDKGELVSAETVNLAGLKCLVADSYLPQSLRTEAALQCLDVVEPRLDASNCLLAGQKMLLNGQTVTPDQLQPLYPREAEAVRLFKNG